MLFLKKKHARISLKLEYFSKNIKKNYVAIFHIYFTFVRKNISEKIKYWTLFTFLYTLPNHKFVFPYN